MATATEKGVLLGDVAELVRGVSYRPEDLVEAGPDAVALLRATNIGSSSLVLTDVLHVPSRLVRRAQLLRQFDVVIAMSSGSRAAVGRLAQLRQDWVGCVGAFCAVIRPDPKRVDPQYIGYALQAPAFRARIDAVAEGTAIMNLSRERLLGYPMRLPPIEEQRAIASVLGALDDKIELNRRMSETLEALARAIFTSWFVDFDPVRARAEGRPPVGMDAETAALFPDSFEDSPLGPIPSGWRVQSLDAIGNFLNGLALQRYPPAGAPGDLPVIKIPELRSGVTPKTGRASDQVPNQYVVEDGDVLFSWSGSLAAVLWAGGRGALNQHLFRVTSDSHPRWLYYFSILEHLPSFQRIAAGKATTMGHIQRAHLSQALCVVPTEAVIGKATDAIEPMLSAIVANGRESRLLAQLRDALLPRLVSGQVRIRPQG